IYGKQNINTSKGGFLISLELLLTDEYVMSSRASLSILKPERILTPQDKLLTLRKPQRLTP
ncbi:hypothetical protein Bca52824_010827, partial [Brassica carinata]